MNFKVDCVVIGCLFLVNAALAVPLVEDGKEHINSVRFVIIFIIIIYIYKIENNN